MIFPAARRFLTLASAVALGAACAPKAAKPAHPAQMMKWRDPTAPRAPAPPTGSLLYYGGDVISNVEIVLVFWGSSVRADTVSQMPGFFQSVTNSSYLDFLNEYNTTINDQSGAAGTQQLIGRGTYATSVTINPSNTATTLASTDIATELGNQIGSGALPPPNADTIYMTYFPPGISITLQGTQSCQAGGFCAFHNTFMGSAGQPVYYGVMPDNSPGSGCDQGCGSLATAFDDLCLASSHEMTEAITDAEVGLAGSSLGPPLGWFDSSDNEEIGDLCNGMPGQVGTYNVQLEFSDAANSCVSGRTNSNDFSVSLSPLSVSIAAGTSTSVTVTTASTSGNPGALALTVNGLPSGVTGTLNPTSVTAGQTSTLTLTAASGAAQVTNVPAVVVGSASGTPPHSASTLVTVKPPPPNDFALQVSPSTLSIEQGNTGTLTVTTQTSFGTPAAVTFSTTGLPTTITGQFSSATAAVGQSTTLTLSVDALASVATFPFTISAQNNVSTHQASVMVQVVAAPPLSVAISSPSNGMKVSGLLPVTATARLTGGAVLQHLEIDVDGTVLQSGLGSPLTASLDTTQLLPGVHQLVAKGTDTSGDAATSTPVSITVDNGAGQVNGSCGCGGPGGAPEWTFGLAALFAWARARARRT